MKQKLLCCNVLITGLLLATASVQAVADSHSGIPDAEHWYVQEYGPVWKQASDQTAAQAAAFYLAEIREHTRAGEILTHESINWLNEVIASWQAEGWTGSELPNLVTERINSTTASFKARYLDRYASGDSLYSCAWYLADFIEGKWQFSAYAEIDCGSHAWPDHEELQ